MHYADVRFDKLLYDNNVEVTNIHHVLQFFSVILIIKNQEFTFEVSIQYILYNFITILYYFYLQVLLEKYYYCKPKCKSVKIIFFVNWININCKYIRFKCITIN